MRASVFEVCVALDGTYIRLACMCRRYAKVAHALLATRIVALFAGHIEGAVTCPTRQVIEFDGVRMHRRHVADIDGNNIVDAANTLYGYAQGGGYIV